MVNVANAGTVASHTARPVYRPVILKWLRHWDWTRNILLIVDAFIEGGKIIFKLSGSGGVCC